MELGKLSLYGVYITEVNIKNSRHLQLNYGI